MPLEAIAQADLEYYLISFDSKGQERYEPDGSLLSETVLGILNSQPITDVFLFSHGWMGDVPVTRRRYGQWIKAMADNTKDIAAIKQLRPDFKPLLIGLHWPSRPWGDESLAAQEPVEAQVSQYAARIAETDDAKAALRMIFAEGVEDLNPDELSPKLIAAYTTLNQESGLGAEGLAGAPGDDRLPFDPAAIYEASELELELLEESESYGLVDGFNVLLNRVFAPLRMLSYWKMKQLAREIGENAGFKLLSRLQQASPAETRFHLMGHSFGCIVMSGALAGPKNSGVLPRPVNSLALVQGALSLWAYCADIPKAPGKAGYFYPVVRAGKVDGPIVVTHSDSDTAVGKMYPLASGVAMSSLDFAPGDWPKYGAIGSFGIQGPGLSLNHLAMLPRDGVYEFEAGQIYNLEASEFITPPEGAGALTGSHNAIANPEVAHAVWLAAMGSEQTRG